MNTKQHIAGRMREHWIAMLECQAKGDYAGRLHHRRHFRRLRARLAFYA